MGLPPTGTVRTRVSVIIPAHNAESTLGEQLRAVLTQDLDEPFEVIVAGNRCTDGTRSLVEEMSLCCPELRFVEASHALGAAHARNVGSQTANGDFLVYCDADDEVLPGWLAAMVSALDTADLVGGDLIPFDHDPEWAVRSSVLPVRDLQWVDRHLRYVISASCACHRSVWQQAGGWDESIGAAGEDIAFSIRVQRSGFRIAHAPEARCRYRLRSSFRAAARQRVNYGRGRARIASEYGLDPERGIAGEYLVFLRSISGEVKQGRSARTLGLLASFHLPYLNAISRAAAPHLTDEARNAGDLIVSAVGRRLRGKSLLHRARRWIGVQPAEERLAWRRRTVERTLPEGTPILGGRALSMTSDVARTYRPESLSLRVMEALLPPGGVMLDVGANVGVYSAAAGRLVGRNGTVVAIEPNSRVLPMLHTNLDRHSPDGIVRVVAAAAGAHPGRIDLAISPYSLIVGVVHSDIFGGPVRTEAVPVIAIDDLALERVDFVKVDVEGYEPEVFDGMVLTLERSPDAAILFELSPSALEASGYSAETALSHEILRTRELLLVSEEETSGGERAVGLFPLDAISLQELTPAWYANVLAIPRSRLSEITELRVAQSDIHK